MLELPPVKQFVSDTGVRVYRIPFTFMPALSGRVYLLLEAGPPTLVDAGNGQEAAVRDIFKGLEAVRAEFDENIRVSDIRRFLVTHAHVDHVGGLWRLAQQTSAEVLAHALDARRISAIEERGTLAERALLRFLKHSGVPPEEYAQIIDVERNPRQYVRSIPVDRIIADGEQLDGLEFIHTPGHSPGHLCIRVGNILITGDHVLLRTVPQIWPESTAPYTGLGHYLDSLAKVRRLCGIELALGGHEPPVRNFYRRIDEIEASHRRRLDRLMGILRKAPRPLSVYEITQQMYSVQKGFHTMLALSDVGSRVEYLDERGFLSVANLDEFEGQDLPVYRYRPA